MHTTHFEIVRVSVSVATIRCCSKGGWVGPEMNKFEQVSSNHSQMPLAGDWVCSEGGLGVGVYPGG